MVTQHPLTQHVWGLQGITSTRGKILAHIFFSFLRQDHTTQPWLASNSLCRQASLELSKICLLLAPKYKIKVSPPPPRSALASNFYLNVFIFILCLWVFLSAPYAHTACRVEKTVADSFELGLQRLWAATWVMETESVSSATATSVPNYLVISPAPVSMFYTTIKLKQWQQFLWLWSCKSKRSPRIVPPTLGL